MSECLFNVKASSARMVAVVAALALLLPLLPTTSAAAGNSFLRQNLSPDLGNNGFSDFNARRQGRYFYFGNGTAMINTTTVAIGATFASFIGLGLLSVYGQAVGEANARLAASAANATASKVGEQPDDLDYDAEYERQYAEYLRQYQVWAETYGQDPVPPASARSKRSDNGPADFNAMKIIEWIGIFRDMYERFDYNDLECQKRLICDVMRDPEYYGAGAQKFKTGFQAAKFLEVLSLPDDLRELLDEYLDANARADQSKDCSEYFQCPFSINDSVKRNLSGNSL